MATRYFTPNEVRRHNTEDDCWVSLLGKVLDLTPLIAQYKGAASMPIVRSAGTDISNWIDKSKTPPDIHRCTDMNTGLQNYYHPDGRFIHVPSLAVDSSIDHGYEVPWWQDESYVIGFLTKKPRLVRIINTLNHHETTLEVCSEEALADIQKRYIDINAHAGSYTWKRQEEESRELDMAKTLEENDIFDETDEFEKLGLPEDYYTPAIHLYFNDDLTVDDWAERS
ncbi:cytochrome b5 domain containing 1 [Diplonema papillatum]|nr:cytochrome b5 domain containing 1 [Diplonema papillatum]